MVAGVPVVARQAGAIAETVGDAALLLKANQPAYVAAALHRLRSDDSLRRVLVAAGQRRAPDFSLAAVAPKVVAAVASVAGPPR
jgi:glycosyltransferase involved in cell wall biosynthesis